MSSSGRWAIAVIVGLVVMAGWWWPNMSEWDQCGTPVITSMLRGFFGKPSTLECLGASLNQPASPPADPASVPPVVDSAEPHTCVSPALDPVCPQPSTPAKDPGCTWVVPADRDPLWIYPDGSPC